MSKLVSKNIVFRDRNFILSYPTVGQLIDIRVLEKQLSRGTANDLLMGTGEDVDAFIYIRTFAHIKVLIPELVESLNVNSMLDLSVIDYQDLVDLYSNEIQPWLTEWQTQLKEKMTARKSEKDTQ